MAYEQANMGQTCGVRIKVIGVGGGGGNAVNRMISNDIRGVEFVTVNTDMQALITSNASQKLIIGEKVTRGFGAGANPENGKRSAEESIEEIKKMLEDTDMVFITTGMGGGTGTGATPIIAQAAHEMGILTVGIVTKPFHFEGRRRMIQAEEGIKNLRQHVDSLIIIPNERLKQVSDTRITMTNAFEVADDVLRRGVQSVSELINVPGYINLDFADVTSVMKDAGFAHMGVGSAQGANKAQLAAMAAISSPLLETSIAGATGILLNVTGDPNLSLEDVDIACAMVADEAHPDANIIFGASFDPSLEDEMRITIIATGFEDAQHTAATPSAADRTTIPQKPTPMPARNTFSAGAYTPAPVVPPSAEQPLFSNPIRETEPAPAEPAQAAPATPAEPAAQEPVRPASADTGRVSDDEFGLIMDILNRSRKK